MSWKLEKLDYHARFIAVADQVNQGMSRLLNEQKKSLSQSTILLLGMAYKANISDIRESPAITIGQETYTSVLLDEEQLSSVDSVILLTDHHAFDTVLIATHARLILDCRYAWKGKLPSHIYRL